ncbi:hypothetical protein BDN72DRAFT_482403 [Pluteus cervinus]|uniref:Uncharacterized protein n=1 Tax=Pluteus cervinus TaxID=181527 RepID=A0ACD3AZB8_9AGAR|nr:hypothetical protein BDN72DRAFT_482403 [Pluteus cervinus]
MSALNGQHRGEREIHKKLHWDKDPSVQILYSYISGDLPTEHAIFHSQKVPFLPIVTLGPDGRPWSSILAGEDGRPGFIRYSRYSTLTIDANVWKGDPILENSKSWGGGGESRGILVAGLGIDYGTRRRNKFAGKVAKANRVNDAFHLEFSINEAIGNCPKYITIRDLVPYTSTHPVVAYKNHNLSEDDQLPEDALAIVKQADTVFLGTEYIASASESDLYPSHLGLNQRGGRPGFVRISPSNGRYLYLPDYSGNKFMTSLGNVEATPLASLTFINFLTGDILYLTGNARNIVGEEAHNIMPLHNLLTEVYVTGYTLVRDALPIRQRSGSSANGSPYSPPLKYLKEEMGQAKLSEEDKRQLVLRRIDLHSPTIATFYWDVKDITGKGPIEVKPGQSAIMDFRPLLGARQYQHMAPSDPTSVNDDKIRTWTISSVVSAPTSNPSSSTSPKFNTFALTMRQKPGGLVTGALFNIARKLASMKPEVLVDARPLDLTVNLVGISGDFVLQEVSPSAPACERPLQLASSLESASGLTNEELGLSAPQQPVSLASVETQKLLWIAGGIGITPFLSMLQALTTPFLSSLVTTEGTIPPSQVPWDIQLLLSTREPEVLLPLIARSLSLTPYPLSDPSSAVSASQITLPSNLDLVLHVFSTTTITSSSSSPSAAQIEETTHLLQSAGIKSVFHTSRLDEIFLAGSDLGTICDRTVFLCGPPAFEKVVLKGLEAVGVDSAKVRKEGFEY